MKTSVVDAHDSLSRYDETQVNVADIRLGVRQRAHESDVPADASASATPDAPNWCEDHESEFGGGLYPEVAAVMWRKVV